MHYLKNSFTKLILETLIFLAFYMKLIVYNCNQNFNAAWNEKFFYYNYIVSTLNSQSGFWCKLLLEAGGSPS